MKKNNKLIYFITSIFMYGAGFSSIFRLCKSNSWIVILIGSIISIIFLPIYKKIINKNNKYIKLINILFILLICMMILRIFITSFYLTKTPGLFITIPFILLCLRNKDINTLYKESNLLFLFSAIGITLNIIAATKTGSIKFLTPTLNISLLNIIKGIIYYVIFTLSPLILIKDSEIDNKLFIFTNIFLVFMSVMIIFILGPNLISIYRFPEYMIYKEINLFGFVENVENLVCLVYFLNIFITSSLCLINIKNVVKNNYTFYILVTLILFITEFVSDKYKCSLFIYKYLPLILLVFIFFNVLKKE
ncbi:MAG: hypothetical protein IKX00_02100 [Bacilli bacterium]|nr:hypothetical protein [Bacilli bacterium]